MRIGVRHFRAGTVEEIIERALCEASRRGIFMSDVLEKLHDNSVKKATFRFRGTWIMPNSVKFLDCIRKSA